MVHSLKRGVRETDIRGSGVRGNNIRGKVAQPSYSSFVAGSGALEYPTLGNSFYGRPTHLILNAESRLILTKIPTAE